MLRRAPGVDTEGKLLGKRSSLKSPRVGTGIPPVIPASQPLSPEEERFDKIRQGKKTISRDTVCEVFRLDLNPALLQRFFAAMKVEGNDIDFAAFQRIVNVLESPSNMERQRTVFIMFDPAGQGRVSKKEFFKVAQELMVGVGKTSAPTPTAAAQSVVKPVLQMFVDTAFTVHCVDEAGGMDFKEWSSFAETDPEVCRLISALDCRMQSQETGLRRRFLI